jgi:urea transport system ATP-binding protein
LVTDNQDTRKMFEVRNLSSAYGQSEVLHGIDLSVAQGEIVALVGRNGMGKSTLMKSLIGVMPARSGQIVVDGADVTSLAPHQRVARGLAYVPQGRQIFGTMTVKENIETGLVVTGKTYVPREIYDLFPILVDFQHRRGGTSAASATSASSSASRCSASCSTSPTGFW